MTELLYYQDPYKTEFEASVLSFEKEGDRAFLVLDATSFFPEQGGQYADEGTINGLKVEDVQLKSGEVIHYMGKDAVFMVGEKVYGKVDFTKRFDRMQNHTGEHILSGKIHKMTGFDNVGFHLSDDIMTLDINGVMTWEQLRTAERKANEAVFADLKVDILYPTDEELKTIEYRSKKEINGKVRLVKIGDADICACCAPHVAYTGQIGLIKIVKAVKYKSGMRLNVCCGRRALADYNMRYDEVEKVSVLLSAKPEEIGSACESILDKYEKEKFTLKKIKRELIKEKISDVEHTGGNLTFEIEDSDNDDLREAVNEGVKKCDGICAAYTRTGEGYSFVMGVREGEFAPYRNDILTALGGKGGGRGNMISGTLSCDKEKIEEFFKEYKRKR